MTPRTATFDVELAARTWRRLHGGHLFLADNGVWHWFDLSHPPTAVLRHPTLRGRGGMLNP